MKLSLSSLLCGLLSTCCVVTNAQTIYVDANPNGMQSNRLSYAFKQNLLRSATLKAVDNEKDSVMQVHLNLLDTDQSSYSTAYSVVWTFTQPAYPEGFKFYDNSLVGICGSNRIAECADSLTAQTDQLATQLRQLIRQAYPQKK